MKPPISLPMKSIVVDDRADLVSSTVIGPNRWFGIGVANKRVDLLFAGLILLSRFLGKFGVLSAEPETTGQHGEGAARGWRIGEPDTGDRGHGLDDWRALG
jgi:hypothetical protein